jgi:serine protease Do
MRHPAIVLQLAAFLGLVGCAGPSSGKENGDGLTRLDFRHVVRKAKDKVFPAVVYIKCIREGHEQGKRVTQEVSGSGVIVSAEGEALTNWHVVDKAVEIRCLLYDGRAMDAKRVGADKDTDLALLQLKVPPDAGPLSFAAMGDSSLLKEGDFVMAMGAPWGLSRSVSIGIISCARRYLPANGEYSLWLQTDASISPGNSGGPLVNTDGQVIGITTLGSRAGGDLGFAVPSDTIQVIVSQLRLHGRVDWSWTGLQLQPLKDFNRNIYFDASEGVMVAGTDPDSPARRAGIQPRDRLVTVNGSPVNAVTEEHLPALRRALGLLPKLKPSAFGLVRDGKPVTVELVPREKGKVEGESLDCPRWDFTVKSINQFDNADLYFHRKEGVFVFGVKQPGNAAAAGLAPQDILLEIDGKKVVTLEDVKGIHQETINGIRAKHRAILSVLRNGLLRQVVLDFARDYEKE